MARALLVIDVQNDFCEGGAAVAKKISAYLDREKYDKVFASRDWHNAEGTNSGHFAEPGQQPDFVTSWPVHCVANTAGANYHSNLNTEKIDIHIYKGQGQNGYSIFEGVDERGIGFAKLIAEHNVEEVDVVGIATDHCVLASALDANQAGLKVRVISSLTAGVSPASTEAAIDKMIDAGISVVASA